MGDDLHSFTVVRSEGIRWCGSHPAPSTGTSQGASAAVAQGTPLSPLALLSCFIIAPTKIPQRI